ncbi:hypothetical protein ZIOFF_000812 [Zingiber officinale]|uniref:Deoxyuridine 5'-triphosphate nucleotidohydrolase n=1 Tax=Zingiber officinale TaxID=94328 RepID=A0A8J5I507_ZINOF|nr:hypothetical protein ZIOFF_000812 [Zingiber officinale]
MQPSEVNTRNLMDGRISLNFNNYITSSSARATSYNSKDEEIQSDEETFHTLAVLAEKTPEDPIYGEEDYYYNQESSIVCISLEIPYGSYGRIATRSSAAWNLGLDVGAGVIDNDYRGEIIILAFNHSNEPVQIQPGNCIAQIIFEKILTPDIYEVPKSLSTTVRGDGGFGSTSKAPPYPTWYQASSLEKHLDC